MHASSTVYGGFLAYTSSAAPADVLVASMTILPFYLLTFTSIGDRCSSQLSYYEYSDMSLFSKWLVYCTSLGVEVTQEWGKQAFAFASGVGVTEYRGNENVTATEIHFGKERTWAVFTIKL